MTYQNVAKIDELATDGLAGTSNSLAYRVHEIEKHFHSIERWYGTDGDSTGSTANATTPFVLVSGNDTWGTEVLMLAANDVLDADMGITVVKFDIHRIMVVESDTNDVTYIIQLWGGTGAFGAATLLTETPYRTSNLAGEGAPIACQMSRQPVANKIWGRVWCATNTAEVHIIIGVHAYAG